MTGEEIPSYRSKPQAAPGDELRATSLPWGRLLRLFADLLEYPRPGLAEAAQECEALLAPEDPEAAALLHEFRLLVQQTPLGGLEEVYTGSFDLGAVGYPYVGYQLFGESYPRSLFMLGLKARYRAHGFVVEKELPDHLAVLLGFLATCDEAGLAAELIREALLPALERMVGESEADPSRDTGTEQPFHRGGHLAYRKLLQALQRVLQRLSRNDKGQKTKHSCQLTHRERGRLARKERPRWPRSQDQPLS